MVLRNKYLNFATSGNHKYYCCGGRWWDIHGSQPERCCWRSARRNGKWWVCDGERMLEHLNQLLPVQKNCPIRFCLTSPCRWWTAGCFWMSTQNQICVSKTKSRFADQLFIDHKRHENRQNKTLLADCRRARARARARPASVLCCRWVWDHQENCCRWTDAYTDVKI